MEFVYDGEFLEDGETIMPISIGVVANDGASFYRVFGDWLCSTADIERVREHDFLMAFVVPHLPTLAQGIVAGTHDYRVGNPGRTFAGHPVIAPRAAIRQDLEAFIRGYGDDRSMHELWAYYGAYDHVMLAQLWGRMIDLPRSVPMFTSELMQLESDVNQRRAAHGLLPPVVRPVHDAEHHALADARWGMALRRILLAADVSSTTAPRTESVVIPRVTLARLWERYASVGPNDGLTGAEQDAMESFYDEIDIDTSWPS